MEAISLSEGEGTLVDGPVSILVTKGAIDVFGKICREGDEFVVVYGKTFPIQAILNSKLKLRLRSSSDYVKVGDRLIPKEWDSLVDLLMDRGNRVAMVLGDRDTGKSSLVLYAANRLCSEGYKTAVVDADIGQSDVGPPGVIGMCVVDATTTSLMELPLSAGHFIGDKTPSGHFLSMVLGTKWMVDEALKADVKTVIIDTTGMVYGGPARILKEKKIEAVSPDIIAVLQRMGEIEHLLTPHKDRYKILRLPVPIRMKRTSIKERISLRGLSMHKYMENMEKLTLDMDRVVLRETFLGTGVEKPDKKVELSKILKCDVLYIEEAPDALIALVNGVYYGERVSKLRETYNKDVRIVRVNWLTRLMLGLLDRDERLLDIGFLESINLNNRQLVVSTRMRDKNVVKYVKLGYLRIDKHGNEIGRREINTI